MVLSQGQKHLLAFGIDERVFEEGVIRQKVFEYGEDFDSVHIICRSFKPRSEERVGKVVFYPVIRRSFLFPLAGLLLGYGVVKRYKGRWLISSDNPFELGLVSWMLSVFYGAKLHLHIHTDLLSPYFRGGSFKERLRYWCGRFVIPRADCIRAVSKRIKRSLLSSRLVDDESRITVLPIATNIREFTPLLEYSMALPRRYRRRSSYLPQGLMPRGQVTGFTQLKEDRTRQRTFGNYSFRMVAVGRFVDKEKNFSMLIDLMRDFVTVCPRSLLVLVGDGPDGKNYQLQIANYKLRNNVIIESWRDDLPAFYKNFDLFLLSSNYEGWGRVVIEAMASGLPVVMTDVGLAGEVVRDGLNGLVVPVGDRSAFLRACVDLYNDHAKRHRFLKAARETVLKMTADNHGEYAKRYREILTRCTQ